MPGDIMPSTHEIWSNMVNVLKPVVGEKFSVIHFDVDDNESRMTLMQNITEPWMYVRPGRYVKLVKNGCCVVMSNTPMELVTNEILTRNPFGHILIGGLGLGCVLMSIQDNPNVLSVTVVELEEEVIRIVGGQLPLNPRVRILQGDIMTWTPPKDAKYDIIYFDIWDSISLDNLKAMHTLHRRFGRFRNKDNPKSWMQSWRKYFLERERRRESRYRGLRW